MNQPKYMPENIFLRLLVKYYNQILIFILCIGCLVRLLSLSSIPIGLNQDEAYAGYEAYSLLNYGMDSHGYANPVYFVSWGSGMNVLYSYLTIPFIFLTGNHLTTFAIRLPQAIFSCISLVIFYLLLNKLFQDKRKSLLGVFILAITPWHIMLSRWGLESNIAPAFLLFGLFFWIKSLENSKFYILSAIFYGLSLYAYAPLWMSVPLILLLQFLYTVYCNKFKWDKYFSISFVLLFIIALPLILFLLINNGIIPEIRTGKFSIPKLLEYRGGEISLQNLKTSIYNFFLLFSTQNDHLIWNSTTKFGMYYKFSIVYIVIGLISICKTAIKNIKKRVYNALTFIFIQIIVSILFAFMISAINVNKINMIHIPLLICCIQGIIVFSSLFKKPIYQYIILIYTISFIAFASFYFTSYNEAVAEPFQYGVKESVQAATAITNSTICIDKNIFYSNVLFATQTPVTNYLATVSYDPITPTDATPLSFNRYIFGYDVNNLDKDYVYIINNVDVDTFLEANFLLETHGKYSIAYYKN